MFKYNSIFAGAINGFDWQPVYGQISAEDYADAVIKQVTDSIAAQQ